MVRKLLRQTVSRAFAPSPGPPVAAVDPGAPRSRLQAISRLFANLYAAFVERVEEIERRRPFRGAGGATPGERAPVRLSRERTLLDGIEFVVETTAASYRFLNTLSGAIEVYRVEGSELVPVEVIAVQRSSGQRSGEEFVPIRKRLDGPSSGRASFSFTGISRLVDEYAAEDRTSC